MDKHGIGAEGVCHCCPHKHGIGAESVNMGTKTRLSSYCTKRANNGMNLVTSRKIITRLACPIIRLPSCIRFYNRSCLFNTRLILLFNKTFSSLYVYVFTGLNFTLLKNNFIYLLTIEVNYGKLNMYAYYKCAKD